MRWCSGAVHRRRRRRWGDRQQHAPLGTAGRHLGTGRGCNGQCQRAHPHQRRRRLWRHRPVGEWWRRPSHERHQHGTAEWRKSSNERQCSRVRQGGGECAHGAARSRPAAWAAPESRPRAMVIPSSRWLREPASRRPLGHRHHQRWHRDLHHLLWCAISTPGRRRRHGDPHAHRFADVNNGGTLTGNIALTPGAANRVTNLAGGTIAAGPRSISVALRVCSPIPARCRAVRGSIATTVINGNLVANHVGRDRRSDQPDHLQRRRLTW